MLLLKTSEGDSIRHNWFAVLLRMRDDLLYPVGVISDSEIEAPIPVDPRLPKILRLVVFLSA